MPKKPSRKTIVGNLDRAYSLYIRLKDADQGYNTCYTCGIQKHYKELQAGHFQTRAKYSIRWYDKNVKPQCSRCNITNGGQQYVYGLKLNDEYGPGTADELVRMGNILVKYSNAELLEMTKKYKALVSKYKASNI